MSSTYSTNLAIELIGTGDQAGSWGNTTNTNLGTLIEQAISGYVTQAVSTGTDTTITIPNGATGVARNMYIELTGTGGTNTNLIVPANKKLYFIYNNSTGDVTVKVSGQTGVSVPTGKKMVLVSNGTDIVNGLNYIADFGTNSFTVTNLTATSASITTLTGTSANITTLSGTTATFTSATVTNLALTSLTLSNLSIASANITTLTSGSATITNLINSGGTANGVLYLNGSKVATSGSALVFDGTNLGIGTASPANYANYRNLAISGTTGANIDMLSGSTKVGNLFNDGTNFYAYNVIAGALVFGTNNAERARFDSSGNLGIGTASPTANLHVYQSGGDGISEVKIEAAGVANPRLTFVDQASYNAQIYFNYGLRFYTGSTQLLMLDASGQLGLGVTPSAWSSQRRAIALGAAGNAIAGSTSNGALELYCNATINTSGNYVYNSTGTASLYSMSGNIHSWNIAASGTAGNAITFTQVLAVEGGKSLALEGATSQSGTGITFPATQSAASNANTLDDYEEGNWTGTLKGSTTDPTTPVTATGTYVKIGRQVTVNIQFANVNTTGAAGAVTITGAPFAASGNHTGAASCFQFDFDAGQTSLACFLDNTATTLEMFTAGDSANWATLKHSAGAGRYLRTTLVYQV